jgi:hypothetical protein
MLTAPENNHPDNAEAPLTAEYIAAIDAHNNAMRAYRLDLEHFRAGRMTIERFKEAQAARRAANDAFDAAYDIALASATK